MIKEFHIVLLFSVLALQAECTWWFGRTTVATTTEHLTTIPTTTRRSGRVIMRVKPEHYCKIRDKANHVLYYPVGRAQIPNKCEVVQCFSNNTYVVETCPILDMFVGPGCIIQKFKMDKPYPKCCPDMVCNFTPKDQFIDEEAMKEKIKKSDAKISTAQNLLNILVILAKDIIKSFNKNKANQD